LQPAKAGVEELRRHLERQVRLEAVMPRRPHPVQHHHGADPAGDRLEEPARAGQIEALESGLAQCCLHLLPNRQWRGVSPAVFSPTAGTSMSRPPSPAPPCLTPNDFIQLRSLTGTANRA